VEEQGKVLAKWGDYTHRYDAYGSEILKPRDKIITEL